MTEHEHRGVPFTIGPRTPCPGIGWKIPRTDPLGRPLAPLESQGAFYDDCEDHPEGAYAWAETACRRFIDKALG
ncbi:MAG: hypothetical protein WC565_05230 [Parcubacteria group bacterium]|jgi:hypothetical protein